MSLVRNVLLTLLLIVPSAWAEAPRTYPEKGVQVFLGLDDTSAPTQVQDGRAQDLRNVSFDISKSMRQRYGYDLIGNTLDVSEEDWPDVTSIYYVKYSNATERIIATVSNRIYYLSGSTWTPITVSGDTLTSGQNNQFVWTTALDEIIGTNDIDKPIQWGGATAEALGSVSFTGLTNTVTKAKSIIWFKNYLIVANTYEGGTDYPTRFRWSNVGTINTWSDSDFIDIGELGGQEINAVAELYDNLYIFLTDSIYRISLVGGDSIFETAKVTDDIGCIAKNSIQSITLTNSQNGLVFLDKDKKIYFYNGIVVQDISQLITTTMDGLSGSRLQYAVSADSNTDYILCTTNGSASYNNSCLVFQYQIGEWTKHTNIYANAMAHVLDSNSDDQVYWGNDLGFIYQYTDSNNRDDVASASGTIDAVSDWDSDTASGLQILYDASLNLTADSLIGAPIELVGGTGSGQLKRIVDNTTTGIAVDSDFTTTPSTDTSFEVGAIDSYYITKWYDFGAPAHLKRFGEVYFWAEADVSSTHSLSYATDFSATIETVSESLSSSEDDAIWGSAIWGVSLWGSLDVIFRPAKIGGEGRFLRLKFAEDDPGETFYLQGWTPVYWEMDVF